MWRRVRGDETGGFAGSDWTFYALENRTRKKKTKSEKRPIDGVAILETALIELFAYLGSAR